MPASAESFSYLSVLVSIVIGLGMAQILGAVVRVIHRRRETRVYWPSVAWAAQLFVVLTLVWWADFSLLHHERWTFATFFVTIAIPALIYLAASLLLPSGDDAAAVPMADAYAANRRPFFALVVVAIVTTFVQTYLLDGGISLDADAGMKAALVLLAAVPLFSAAAFVQLVVVAASGLLLLAYVVVLFSNLRG